MISVFAAPTLTATIFCVLCWIYLSFITMKNGRPVILTVGCLLSTIAYIVATIQYMTSFYIEKNIHHETVMWWLLCRMWLHCSAALCLSYYNKFYRPKITDVFVD